MNVIGEITESPGMGLKMITDDVCLDLEGQQTLINEWVVHATAGQPASRQAMQPAQFLTELAHISIIEKQGDELCFRLSGSQIRHWLGTEGRGKKLSEFPTLEKSRVWKASIHEALNTGLPVSGVRRLQNGHLHYWLRLPLMCEDGKVNQVMCHDRVVDHEAALDLATKKGREQLLKVAA